MLDSKLEKTLEPYKEIQTSISFADALPQQLSILTLILDFLAKLLYNSFHKDLFNSVEVIVSIFSLDLSDFSSFLAYCIIASI